MGIEFRDATVGADNEGKREGVPVAVGVWRLVKGGIGMEGLPGAAVVGGNVGAVGAYSDPRLGSGIVGYGGAVTVGLWVCRKPREAGVGGVGSGGGGVIGLRVVSADSDTILFAAKVD